MADREDTDPTGAKGRTEPGLGGPAPLSRRGQAPPLPRRTNGGQRSAPPADQAPPADFGALSSALSANEEAPGKRRSKPDASESQGRSNAQYASAQPHSIPPTRAPNEDPATPAVIVGASRTDPGPPSQRVTARLAHQPASDPQAVVPAAASSRAPAASAPFVHTSPRTPPGIAPKQTVVMPQRPRRPKSATIVVRSRGPSAWEKLAAFVVMLVLVAAVGGAVILWRRPEWLGFEHVAATPPASASTSASSAPAAKKGPLGSAKPVHTGR